MFTVYIVGVFPGKQLLMAVRDCKLYCIVSIYLYSAFPVQPIRGASSAIDPGKREQFREKEKKAFGPPVNKEKGIKGGRRFQGGQLRQRLVF